MGDLTVDRTIIRAAIYTEDRALWLDPEDLDAIVDDVLTAIRGES